MNVCMTVYTNWGEKGKYPLFSPISISSLILRSLSSSRVNPNRGGEPKITSAKNPGQTQPRSPGLQNLKNETILSKLVMLEQTGDSKKIRTYAYRHFELHFTLYVSPLSYCTTKS